MPIPRFRPPWWLIIASGLVFVVCLVFAAWLGRNGHDSFRDNALQNGVQALGAVAFAIGGVGAVIERQAERRWKRALQVVAVDLLEETIRQTGAITSSAAYILLGDSGSAREVAEVFRLPWTKDRDERLRAAQETLNDAATSLTLKRPADPIDHPPS